ncbi:hypothetical protein [Runella aurantiaca]|uniref:Uncharacterized protein n=1 Tax=Runella aurantiaca TaxID=2282308 RepID=A0A369I2Q3_9BACT|nr:hypothetical protein [Runella aurantiaca]RDB03838.1 hypothetical protein DVG78_21525 [Runella aurantiaca]
MTRQEFFEIVGYFANPIRDVRIEIEAREITITNYNQAYMSQTGTPIPIGSDAVTILSNNANKWGREMRVYFICTDHETTPDSLDELMTSNNRPGYEKWTNRLNSRSIIDDLIGLGFRIGGPQNLENIQGHIDPQDLNDFNSGFNKP